MMIETHSEEDANRNVNKYPIVTDTSAVLAVNGAMPAAAASSYGNQFGGKDDGGDVDDDDDDTEEEQAGEIGKYICSLILLESLASISSSLPLHSGRQSCCTCKTFESF